MRFISSKAHGVWDYAGGLVVLLSPWIFGFADIGQAVILPVVVGATTILTGLFTNHELGAVKKISMTTHVMLDSSAGVLLAVSPWFMAHSELIYLPHLILGIVISMMAMFTKTITGTRQAQHKEPGELSRNFLKPEDSYE